jgi:hypothetical protein
MPFSINPTIPDILIFVVPSKLSDGSEVFAVKVGDLVIAAISEDDATDLAQNIVTAINSHSNETAEVIFK